ncbi:hypothetical protein MHU86_9097 [Fragilaria crotonensis]|nr:hypothetical protein MHU86_9097 [Fragilaria crotonensis]
MSRPADGEELHRRREIAVDDGHVSGKKPLAIYVAKRRARKRRQNRASQDGDGSVGHSGGAVQKRLKRIMDNGSKDDKSPRHPDRLARECLPLQEQMLRLLVKGLSFLPGLSISDEELFQVKFCQAVGLSNGLHPPGDTKTCGTPILHPTCTDVCG